MEHVVTERPDPQLGVYPPGTFQGGGRAAETASKQGSPRGRTKAKGRGKGIGESELAVPKKVGKGRATTQGVVIPISHLGREEALAEQALKRKRIDGEEPQDNTEDQILQGFLTKDTVEKGLSARKKKTDSKSGKRDHHACDRCFRNKTKVHPQKT